MKKRYICERCGNQFVPDKKLKDFVSNKCCTICMVRNLYDVLEMPMPPALLDQHAKDPCLTNAEYQAKLEKFRS